MRSVSVQYISVTQHKSLYLFTLHGLTSNDRFQVPLLHFLVILSCFGIRERVSVSLFYT